MRWVVAGGGTGGHFFPALEVACRLRDWGDEVLFLGVKRGIEARLAPRYGFNIRFVPFEGVRGKGLGAVKALLKFPLAVALALKEVKKADAVFCTGGYASLPASVSAFVAGKPLVVHEQNSVPGWSNVLSSWFARWIWISFEDSARFFKASRVFHTGNILRKPFIKRDFSFPPVSKFTLLVVGGSSGARTINRVVCEALPALARMGVYVVHQVGGLDREWVEEAYREYKGAGKPVEFIEDMPSAYREASFVLSRSGATTLFELSAMGRAALLVPYPYAVGNHQMVNAQVVSRRKGARIVENSALNVEVLVKELLKYYMNVRRLFKMSRYMFSSLKVCRLEFWLKRVRDEVSVH